MNFGVAMFPDDGGELDGLIKKQIKNIFWFLFRKI